MTESRPLEGDALYTDVVAKTARHLNPNLAKLMAFAGFGAEMRGEGCYLIDHEGRRFLDMLGGYGTFSLGHRHPAVVGAVRDGLDRLGMSGKAFFSPNAADLAELLAHNSPDGLELAFFSNSGAEAVEAALKFAKGSTGRPGIISTLGSYHGKTLGALATTGREKYRKKFEPLMPGVSFVPFGDAEAATAAVDGETAAFIVEPVQGEGGILLPPDGYLRAVREACDRHGALMIADEVQTGLGRTGALWGVEHDGSRRTSSPPRRRWAAASCLSGRRSTRPPSTRGSTARIRWRIRAPSAAIRSPAPPHSPPFGPSLRKSCRNVRGRWANGC